MRYYLIVAISCILNFTNNALIAFLLHVFIDKAKEQATTKFQIGLYLTIYAIGMIIQGFLIEKLRAELGTKKTYLLGTTLGGIVSLITLLLKFVPEFIFIVIMAILKFFDGSRDSQFEVTTILYFAENTAM